MFSLQQRRYEVVKLIGATPTIVYTTENSRTDTMNRNAIERSMAISQVGLRRHHLPVNNMRMHPYQRRRAVVEQATGCNSLKRNGEVESKAFDGIHLQMSESNQKLFLRSLTLTYDCNQQPKLIAITRHTAGLSIIDDVIVRGNIGTALPSPTLIIAIAKKNCFELMVCDEQGRRKGKLMLHLLPTLINEIIVRENQQELLVSNNGLNGTVWRFNFTGQVLKKSPVVFGKEGAFGMCLLLGGQAVAVCDAWDKSVKILSLPNLMLLMRYQHGNLSHPVSIAVSPQLKWYIIDYVSEHEAHLKIFDQDFNLIRRVDKTFFKAQSILHFEGNVLVTDCHRITSFTESGTQIDSIGQGGIQDEDFQMPVGMGFFMSSVGEPTLVVADCNNDRLKFYKPVNGI